MQIKHLVKTLRQNSVKCKVSHYRFVQERENEFPKLARVTKDNKKTFFNILAKGGETSLFLTFPDGGDYTAESLCSKKDAYQKSLGINICAERIFAKRREEGKIDKLNGVEFV